MRYDDFRRSDNIDDRRDDDGGGFGGGGGGFGIPMGGGGGLGIGTILVLGLIGWAVGIDPRILISGAGDSWRRRQRAVGADGPPVAGEPEARGAEGRDGQISSPASLGSIEDRWKEIFKESDALHRPACRAVQQRHQWRTLRLRAERDGTVLLPAGQADLSRHRLLPRGRDALPRLFRQGVQVHRGLHHRARGRPPRAERARHPRTACGRRNSRRAAVPKRTSFRSGSNCRQTVSPDCGRTGSRRRALPRGRRHRRGAADRDAIGDDTLQRQAQGRVVPDSFTHGSAEQRRRWFMTGYQQGTIEACNTFAPGVRL